MQHPEKIGIVTTGFVYMRICNDYHDDLHRNGSSGCPFVPFFSNKISAFIEAGKKLMSRIFNTFGQMAKKGHRLNEKKMIKYIRY
jgi:hypothetical protein